MLAPSLFALAVLPWSVTAGEALKPFDARDDAALGGGFAALSADAERLPPGSASSPRAAAVSPGDEQRALRLQGAWREIAEAGVALEGARDRLARQRDADPGGALVVLQSDVELAVGRVERAWAALREARR